MSESKDRGSDKLGALSPEALQKSIGAARETYKIERWWKYGQPRIDRILTTINVTDLKSVGQVVTDLVRRQGKAAQINFDVFPYSIVAPDGVRINVRMDQLPG